MKPAAKKLVAILIVYIVTTFAFSIFVEYRYGKIMKNMLMYLGRDYLKEPGSFERDLKEDAYINKFRSSLKFIPPAGWVANWKINRLEGKILNLARLYSTPESSRSLDAETEKYGIRLDDLTDEDIILELYRTTSSL